MFKTVIATSKVNWVTTLDCLIKVVDLAVAKTFKETVEKPKVPRKALVLLIGNGAGPQVCVCERGGTE